MLFVLSLLELKQGIQVVWTRALLDIKEVLITQVNRIEKIEDDAKDDNDEEKERDEDRGEGKDEVEEKEEEKKKGDEKENEGGSG